MSGGIRLLPDSDTEEQPQFRPSGCSILEAREVHAAANAAHVWVDLVESHCEGAVSLRLDIGGTGLRYSGGLTAGGASFDVCSAEAVRALGETLLALADRGEALRFFECVKAEDA